MGLVSGPMARNNHPPARAGARDPRECAWVSGPKPRTHQLVRVEPMSKVRTLENGQVRKLVKFRTGRRKGKSPMWKSKWVVVPPKKDEKTK